MEFVQSLLTEEERDNYDEDWLKMMARIGSAVAQKTLDTRVAPTFQALEAEQERAFARDLSAAVPDWNTLNDDPVFIDWLQQTDPFSGKNRAELFDEAVKGKDAARVAHFFRTYKVDSGITPPASRKTPGDGTREGQVRPKKVAAKGPSSAEKKKLWTSEEYFNVVTQHNRGAISDGHFEKLRTDFEAAMREGRVKS